MMSAPVEFPFSARSGPIALDAKSEELKKSIQESVVAVLKHHDLRGCDEPAKVTK